ncbi:cAMP-specific 3',5'-cyclic phosphodiesterase 7B [Schistosoma japonicum]|nr:cAMP-specific 3',5'-cyclic phosphodiesterase 7B [Schistosoma japonicum]
MQMALKCSDISNPCRIWPICMEWAKRVCSELFCQGDRERFQWSLQPIPTMDRTKFSLARVQIGFIRDMVKPLLTGWHEFFQNNLTLKILQYLDENLNNWLNKSLLSSSSKDIKGKYHSLNYFTRHSSLDSQTTSSSILSSVGNILQNSSIAPNYRLDHSKQKKIKSKISDEKCKIDVPKLFTVSFHSTTSPIEEIETLNTCEAVNSNNHNLRKLQQTMFITTRVMRRHSLPETQLAIRKTFNISLSKKPSTIVLLQNNASTMLSTPSKDNDNYISIPISKIESPSFTVKSSSSSTTTTANTTTTTTTTCTPSANILHMLCEELKNNKTNYSSSRIDSKSIPNTFYCKDNQLLDEKVFDLNREQTFLRFSALAHRRSSAPITEH